MPTITVRLDDEVRDALQACADEESVNVSDFVRELIRARVVSVRDPDEREGFAPDSMTPKERHTLSLLHRILARVLPEDANDVDGDSEYQLERAKVLEEGFTQEYWTEFAGISPELSKRDAKFVMDVLDMFRVVDASIARLPEEESLNDGLRYSLEYQGFDHNDSLELKMANYAEFLVKDGRWEERAGFITGPEHGNSHHPTLSLYSRMLAEYRRLRQGQRKQPSVGRDRGLLNKKELELLAGSRTHPDNR